VKVRQLFHSDFTCISVGCTCVPVDLNGSGLVQKKKMILAAGMPGGIRQFKIERRHCDGTEISIGARSVHGRTRKLEKELEIKGDVLPSDEEVASLHQKVTNSLTSKYRIGVDPVSGESLIY
jgi:hypothetical protein